MHYDTDIVHTSELRGRLHIMPVQRLADRNAAWHTVKVSRDFGRFMDRSVATSDFQGSAFLLILTLQMERFFFFPVQLPSPKLGEVGLAPVADSCRRLTVGRGTWDDGFLNR